MSKKIELLAPGGDIASIKAAIAANADAVYCGLNKFNARNRATNLSIENLPEIVKLAHEHHCEIFITLNIIIVEQEISAFIKLLNRLVNIPIDGIILQDIGMLYLVNKYFKSLKIHASTQVTTHNSGQIEFLNKLGAIRVNLSRELNKNEIHKLTSFSHKLDVQTEVFVHGSNCISFSGLCYMSSVLNGESGNRGRCSQPCRDKYETTSQNKNYPLNLKDNSAFGNLQELYDFGVDSLKIEGRIKASDYVYTVVNAYKQQIDKIYNRESINTNNPDLYKVFNRDLSNAFLMNQVGKNVFIDNPRNNSIQHHVKSKDYNDASDLEDYKLQLYQEKDAIKKNVAVETGKLSIEKTSLTINISGDIGTPLCVEVSSTKESFTVSSNSNLTEPGNKKLTYSDIFKRFKAINETAYCIEKINLKFSDKLFIPFKDLTALKNEILYILNGNKSIVNPITIAPLQKISSHISEPTLSIIISSINDVHLGKDSNITTYFKLPNNIVKQYNQLKNILKENEHLILWFPAILIDDNYSKAIELINELKPTLIVSDNAGIGNCAGENNIHWIAGPALNIANSYSLIGLKETFNCVGAFLSNELNKNQIRSIKKPENFHVFYTIYQPLVLMTSRLCLFNQVDKCEKTSFTEKCLADCEKTASIKHLKNGEIILHKNKGSYPQAFHSTSFLNTDIVTDIPNTFSSYLIDLSSIPNQTTLNCSKQELIKIFQNFIKEPSNGKGNLEGSIAQTTNKQYIKGI